MALLWPSTEESTVLLRTRDGNFSLHGLLGYDLWGKTAGIVGTGRIARCLIRILLGFGMRVLAYDPCPDAGLCRSVRD